uniref:Uncharacterized mitochondrial protein AtMg00810-like n=1 Tax=Nicotiana tabacum TaxID=4097 RepID=A0A1S4CKR5_TOBAC|nr:PREDICTED: uncharacterized mitochondrial protein AtMg00810-like [Nicotiana tabacum]
MTIIRALIGTTVKKVWEIFQLDVNNAFFHGDLHEEVYMEVPPCLVVERPGLVGYTHSLLDYSLFYKKHGTSVVFVAIYIDDVQIIGTDLQEIEALKAFLHETFKIKDLGRLHYFMGLEILYKDDRVLISERKFIMDLLTEFDCTKYFALTSPLDPSTKISAAEGSLLSDPFHYRRLSPREPHLKAAYHVLRYLKCDPSLGIFLSNSKDYRVRAFCDSDWAACPESRKSVSGYVVLLGDSPIS